jgi:hypothetical protein
MTEQQRKAIELLDKYFIETSREEIEAEFASYPDFGVDGPIGADFLESNIIHAKEWINYVGEVDVRSRKANNAKLANADVISEATTNYTSSEPKYCMAA